MLLYHSFHNPPFKAMIVSGLLAAMYNFSKVEIQEQGIQSIEMYDLQWTYLSSEEDNLLLIGADSKNQKSNVMKARLQIILNIFIEKYHIKLKYWEENAYDLEIFTKFKQTLVDLNHEWELADRTKNLGNIFDLLYIFQETLQILIDFINEKLKTPRLDHVLAELSHISPQLKEWDSQGYNPEAFQILQLFIPQIDLKQKKIFFERSTGHSLIQEASIGIETEYIKSFFTLILQNYSEILRETIPKQYWNDLVISQFMPFFLRKWDYLMHLDLLKVLISIFFGDKPK